MGLRTTILSPTGEALGTRDVRRAKHPAVDCFYVYPTVSEQPARNASLRVEAAEVEIAISQAARYSQRCRVFAPMYRQQTIAALESDRPITAAESRIAYRGVLGAWREYLSRFNDGRGFVFIGHSQGSEVLRRLIAEQVDTRPRIRRRMLSALLLGGNVAVRKGSAIGGDFQHIPACRSNRQLGCVVAFSTFGAPVPPDAVYGRIGGPFDPGDPAKLDVLCTNPAALGGGSAPLDSIFPGPPQFSTPWVEFPGAYEGHCSAADGAHVLQVASLGGAPALEPFPDPTWGLHLLDANIALGDLVRLLGDEIGAYGARPAA